MSGRGVILDGVTLREAARQVVANWWVVLAFALAAFLGMTGVGRLTYVPQYTSSATLAIRVKGADAYSSLVQASRMTAVFSEVFQSSALRRAIASSVGEPIEGSVSCAQVPDTNLLTLSVTSSTPRQAYLFIQSALQNYEQFSGNVFADAELQLVQEPSIPDGPSNVSPLIAYRVLGAVLAAGCAVVLVALIYLTRNTVKTADRAPDLLDGRVLGTIPYERKRTTGKGKAKSTPALLISSPLVSMGFAEANRRVAMRLEAHLRASGFKTVLVVSVGENEGKSTVAANLAGALAERGKRVLLIDGDFRKPAQWRIFDEKKGERPSFSDLILNEENVRNTIARNDRIGIYELFQYTALHDPTTVFNSERLAAAMESFRRQFDYVLVDCSPVAAAADAELWMRHVDTVVMVVRQDVADVRIINDTVDVAWKSAKDFSGFVLNAFQGERLSVGRRGYGTY